MKPWEKYPENNSQAPQGPWSKFKPPIETTPVDTVLNEQHPDLADIFSRGTLSRAVVKNFGNSNESNISYLKQQHPDFDFKVIDGEIVSKKPTDKDWYRLDPNQFDSSFMKGKQFFDRLGGHLKEAVKDVADIGYDVVAGTGQGAATAGAAAAGGLATLPSGGVGALPAAVAGGAASGSALEGLRQYLGKAAGIPQEIDSNQVVTSGVVGGLMPMMLGAGNIAKPLRSLGGSIDDATLASLQDSSRGLIKKGLDNIAPKFSSVPETAIEGYSKYKPDMQNIKSNGGLIQYLDDMSNNIRENVQGEKSKIGAALGDAISSSDQKVSLNDAKNQFIEKIANLEANKQMSPTEWTPALESRLQSLKNGFAEHFPQADDVTASRAFDLQQTLKRLNSNFDLKKDANNYDFLNAVDSAYAKLNKGLDEATQGVSSKLKGDYAQAIDLADSAEKFTGDPQKLYQTLSSLDAKSRKIFKDRLAAQLQDRGIDIDKAGKITQAMNYFENPKYLPISGGGTTSTSYSELGHGIGDMVGGMASIVSPEHAVVGTARGAGKILGNFMASPKFTQMVIDANRNQVPYYLNPNLYSPWIGDLRRQQNQNQK